MNKMSEKRALIAEEATFSVKKSPETKNYRYFVLIPILFLFYLGEEITKYSLNEWAQYFVKTEYFPNETFQRNQSACKRSALPGTDADNYKKVQQQASHWLLCFKLAECIPTMLSATVLPSYSDSIGRKMLLLLAGIGCLVKATMAALSIFFGLPLYWIAIGYGIEGVLGGARGYVCLCFSYVADLTFTDSHRVFAMTVVETVIILTSTCGGFVTGYMVESDSLGYKYTAIICVVLMLISLILVRLFLSESLPKETRTSLKPFLETVKQTFSFCFSSEFKGKRKGYILLLLGFAFSELGESNRSGMETLYFLGQPFCWDPIRIGYYSLARHASKGIVGVGILRLLQCCISSEAIAILSSLSNLSSYIIEGLAHSEILVYMATVAGVLTLLVVPMIRGILSTMTPPDKQGSLFASVAVIETVSAIVTMTTQNSVYAATVSIMNGFVFFVMAGFCLVDCILLTMFWCTKIRVEPSYERINDQE